MVDPRHATHIGDQYLQIRLPQATRCCEQNWWLQIMGNRVSSARLPPHWLRSSVFLAAGIFLQGCGSLHAPMKPDATYPHEWGELSALGPECKGLEGSYIDEGVLAGAEGASQPLRLSRVLNILNDSSAITLKVVTRKIDKHGDAFTTLQIGSDGHATAIHERECFCIKEALVCPMTAASSWSVPAFAGGVSQKNVTFSTSQDHSLIAKFFNYETGLVAVVPYFFKKEPWARFERAIQQPATRSIQEAPSPVNED